MTQESSSSAAERMRRTSSSSSSSSKKKAPEVIEILDDNEAPEKKKSKKIYQFFQQPKASSSSSSSSSLAISPTPSWGRIIQEEEVKRSKLQHALRQSPFSIRAYTIHFKSAFNDAYNRVPGVGNASFGTWGNVRSSLHHGSLGGVGREVRRERSATSQQQEEAAEGDVMEEVGMEEDDNGIENGGGQRNRGSKHRSNFDLMWKACSPLLSSFLAASDMSKIEQIQRLSPEASTLFWRIYHSPKAVYRVHAPGDVLEELLKSQLIRDVIKEQDETTLLANLYDVLSTLFVDDLAQLANAVVGKAAASKTGRASKDDSLSAIHRCLAECLNEEFGGAQRLQRLRKEVLKSLQRTNYNSRFVAVPAGLRKLAHRIMAIFFVLSGYEPEDALVLLRGDLASLQFMDVQTTTMDPRYAIQPKHGRLVDYLLALADAFDFAAVSGNSVVAYGCLHSAADLLLPRERPEGSYVEEVNHEVHLSEIFTIQGPCCRSPDTEIPSDYEGPASLPFPLLKLVCKIVGRGIGLLERQKDYQMPIHYLEILLKATSKMPLSLRGTFWTRLVLDLSHLGRRMAALEQCEAALKDPKVDGEDRLFLQNKCTALAVPPKRWKPPKFSPLQKAPVLKIELSLRKGVGGKSLEHRVVDYLLGAEGATTSGWNGSHCENGCLSSLFGLLLWDVIFYNVKGVFPTAYANAPCDLTSRDFLTARKDVAEQVFAKIKAGEASRMLDDVYTKQHGKLCVGVDWLSFSLEQLRCIAEGLGGKALAMMCRLLASDYPLFSHGLPDLLLWKEGEGGGERAVRFVEVKGPGDDLSYAQMVWIDRLLSVGCEVHVARVTNTEDMDD